MKKLKVMTVVGTRPEIIRLSRVITALNEYTDHTLVHTGQNYDYELNEIFFKELSIPKPKYFLNANKETALKTIGEIISKIEDVLEKVKPEAFLVLGDTNSCLAALAAKRKKIPVFHMEAGNRCFDQRVPEEINRRLIDHLSDINLTYSSIARDYLLKEGLPADRVIKTGSPMFEVLHHFKKKIDSSNALARLKLKDQKYIIVSAHREENIDSEINFSKLSSSLNLIAKEFKVPVIVSTHPRTQKRLDSAKIKFEKNIEFLKPLGFFDYVNLQKQAMIVLSDSGTITEESSILGFPAINIREAHERPEGMEEAAVIMSGLDPDNVLRSVHATLALFKGSKESPLRIVTDYNAPNVSEKVVRIILSYTNYVKQSVWKDFR